MVYNSKMNINFDITTIALIILILIVLGLIYYIYHLNNKLNKFLIGSSSTNLDESITSINTNLEDFKKFRAEIEAYLTTVEKRFKLFTLSVLIHSKVRALVVIKAFLLLF